jgi:Ser/Thr protein kinase RdoA (MazF antagonist)
MIHADLHFGNLLLSQGRIAAIDFDDCGFGFHVYDLVVPLKHLAKRRKREYPRFKSALIEGYSRHCGWDKHDEEVLSYMMIARGLAMLGWLNSRSDNPSLRKPFKIAASRVVKELRALDSGS